LTIRERRLKFIKLLNDNPGLKPQLADILQSAYDVAVLNAANETNIDEIEFPLECPWTFEQIVDKTFFPGGES
jgi:hypothetical protein